MAAVIAHEVRNLLAAVRGAVQVIGSRLPPNANEGAIVTEIIARLDGLNDLIPTCWCLLGRRHRSRCRPTCARSPRRLTHY